MTETVERAALQTRGGLVFSVERPGRHNHVIAMMAATGPYKPVRQEIGESTQGFVTSTGRFVGREEAAQIATAAGQLIERAGRGTGKSSYLYSEDVW